MAKRKAKKVVRRRKESPFDVLVSLPVLGLFAVIMIIIAIFSLGIR